jgi:Domain of unknown function (DUF4062)
MADAKLFLSCVWDEFGEYRDELRRALTRPNVEIKIQEDFQNLGGDTLALLETYVESCDVVVHFIGDMAGSTPKPSSVDDLLRRRPDLAARLAEKGMDRGALGCLTYTQWEAWLAIGFNQNGAKKNLVIVAPAIGLKRSLSFAPTDATRASQADHLTWLRAINFYPAKPFTSADNLVARVFGSAVLDALKKAHAGSLTKPRNLPFASLGGLFAGRDEDLADLHSALLGAKALRSRFTASGASARRGSRSNMRGLASRTIRRCCSSARATAPRSTRVWRGSRPSRFSTCRRKGRATTRPRSPPSCAGLSPTRHG